MSERELPGMTERASSPLAGALALVGDRWTLLVVQALLGGSRRFNDLLEQIPGIAPNILSERLKRLERDALLVSRPYSDRPPRAAYELTAEGMELAGTLRLLAHWGARHDVAAWNLSKSPLDLPSPVDHQTVVPAMTAATHPESDAAPRASCPHVVVGGVGCPRCWVWRLSGCRWPPAHTHVRRTGP